MKQCYGKVIGRSEVKCDHVEIELCSICQMNMQAQLTQEVSASQGVED